MYRKNYDSRKLDFIKKVQANKSLDEIFNKAECTQELLIFLILRTVIHFSIKLNPYKIQKIKDLITKKIALKILINKINSVISPDFFIIENGIKKKKRIFKKIRNEYKETEFLVSDISRITLTCASPKSVKNLVKFFGDHYEFHETPWKIESSGVIHSIITLNIKGCIAQVRFDEKQQALINTKLTHKIFKLIRKLKDNNHLNLEKIRIRYNNLMHEFKTLNENYLVFPEKENITDFSKQNISFRYRELLLLHQSIHIDEILKANKEWREFYAQMAIVYNNNIEKKKSGVKISEFLLKRIPEYQIVLKREMAKNKNFYFTL